MENNFNKYELAALREIKEIKDSLEYVELKLKGSNEAQYMIKQVWQFEPQLMIIKKIFSHEHDNLITIRTEEALQYLYQIVQCKNK